MVGRRTNLFAVVELELEQRIAPYESRRVQKSHDEPPIRSNAVAPEQLAGLGSSCHILERRCRAIHERHARVAAEATRVGRIVDNEINSDEVVQHLYGAVG